MSSSVDSTKILNQHQSEQNEQNEKEWVLLSLDPPSSSTPPIPIIQDIRTSPTSPTFQLSTSIDTKTQSQSQSQTQTQKGWIKNTGTIPFWLKWMYLNQMSSCRSN